MSHWVGLLDGDDWRERSRAAFELMEMSRSSKEVLRYLGSRVLQDQHAAVRLWAVYRLTQIGEIDDEQFDVHLTELAKHEIVQLYLDRQTLKKMRTVYERIINSWLRNESAKVRWNALLICEMLGRRHSEAFREDLEHIVEFDDDVRNRAFARWITVENYPRGGSKRTPRKSR